MNEEKPHTNIFSVFLILTLFILHFLFSIGGRYQDKKMNTTVVSLFSILWNVSLKTLLKGWRGKTCLWYLFCYAQCLHCFSYSYFLVSEFPKIYSISVWQAMVQTWECLWFEGKNSDYTQNRVQECKWSKSWRVQVRSNVLWIFSLSSRKVVVNWFWLLYEDWSWWPLCKASKLSLGYFVHLHNFDLQNQWCICCVRRFESDRIYVEDKFLQILNMKSGRNLKNMGK